MKRPPKVLSKHRQRLFTKYVTLFVAIVLSRSYRTAFSTFYLLQRTKPRSSASSANGQAAAAAVGQFVKDRGPARLDDAATVVGGLIERAALMPCGWCAGSLHPELAQLDATGRAAAVSRLAMDVVASGSDLSTIPSSRKRWRKGLLRTGLFSPAGQAVHDAQPSPARGAYRRQRRGGQSKLIWDVVTQIKVGERGHAYVVDARGRLVAHPILAWCCVTPTCRGWRRSARRAGTDGSHEGNGAGSGKYRRAQGAPHRSRAGGAARLAGLRQAAAAGAYAPLPDALQRLAFVLLAAVHCYPLPGCFSPRRWPIRHCSRRRAAAAAILASASRSRPGTNSGAPTSSTIWPDN